MKKIISISMVLTSFIFASNSAEILFDNKCTVCHSKIRPSDMNKVVAPAIMGVMRHIKMEFKDDKQKAVNFMADYILNPSKEKAICKPKKLEKFGVMPSQKGIVTLQEAKDISSYLYDNFPPAGFRGMGQRNR